MKKIIIITEFFDNPIDEGIKKSVYNLYQNLSIDNNVRVVCRNGSESDSVYVCNTNRLFLSKKLYDYISSFSPNYLIYFPFQSSTFASFVRNKILKAFSGNIKTIFIALQPKKLNIIENILLNLVKPDVVLTSSIQLSTYFKKNNIKTELIPQFTKLEKFYKLREKSEINLLRKKYNLTNKKKIITHVGHLRKSRNLDSLINIQRSGHQVLIISSTSTPGSSNSKFQKEKDKLRLKLRAEGIIIIENYIKNINEIYQLSDVYVFPVIEPNACIDLPLSILEARACGIPCVCTNFGSISHFLGNDYEGIIYSETNKFNDNIDFFLNSKRTYYKSNVSQLNHDFINLISNHLHN